MIDLHIHTKYSDGTDECIQILKMAQEKQLNVISITDHNTCKAYEELKKIEVKEYYLGKIISGVELNTKILGIPIEVLGYGIDPVMMQKSMEGIYLSSKERNIIEIQRLYDKCILSGIKLKTDFLEKYDSNLYASKYFHNVITKEKENRTKIDEDAWNDSNVFYRKYMSNPQTLFYVDMNDILPDFSTVTKLIKDAGGKVFLPHIYEYRDNADKILTYILENYKIDGIECYYTTFKEWQTKELLDICKNNNLFISAGSDYHGKNKVNTEIGTGNGNLNVPESIISNWSDLAKWI